MTESGIPMDLTGWWAAMVPTGDAAAGHRPDQQVVRADGVDGRNQEIPQQLRRRSEHRVRRRSAKQFLKDIKDWGDYVRMAKIPQI